MYGASKQQVRADLEKVILNLEALVWIVNGEKSSLVPSQSKVFLRYLVDSWAQKHFPRRKKEKSGGVSSIFARTQGLLS